MVPIRNLEMHLAHSCNLSCESCSHYSDQGHKGLVSLDEAEQWMRLWHRRIEPRTFSLLGGEPTIHPKLSECVELARQYWPTSHLRLVTNGFFLHRHPRLPEVLSRDPDACLYISIHHDAPAYREKLAPVIALVKTWVRQYGIRVQEYRSHKNWTRRYQGQGPTFEPYADGKPRQSWEKCPARYCPQLFQGKIWKCGPLAYLRLQGERYPLSASWAPYMAYQPLEPACDGDELRAFFAREDESACGMCPARPERFALPVPLRVVSVEPSTAG